MARTFNGTSDKIVLNPGACKTLNGDITIAAIVNLSAFPTAGNMACIWAAGEAATNLAGYSLNIDENGYPVLGTQTENVHVTSGEHITTGKWWLVACTKATGTNTVKSYLYNFETAKWFEATSSGTLPNPAGTATQLSTGAKEPTNNRFLTGAEAIIGVKSAVLTKANLESTLAEAVSWLTKWEALAWTGLWAFNQASTAEEVKDKTAGKADQKSISGTTVSSGEPVEYSGSSGVADGYDSMIEAEPTLLDYFPANRHTGVWPGGKLSDTKTAGNALTLAGAGVLDEPDLLPAMGTGKSAKFTAGTALKTAASGMPLAAEGMSLELWIKPEATVAETELQIWSNDRVVITMFGSTFYANLREGANKTNTEGFFFETGKVYHVVATWNGGSELKLYINGQLISTAVVVTPPTGKPTYLVAGSDKEEAAKIKSSIARMAQYVGALSAAKVEEHYNVGAGIAPPPGTSAGSFSEYDDTVYAEGTLLSYFPLDKHQSLEMNDVKGSNQLTLKGSYAADKAALLPRISTGKAFGVNGGSATRTSGTTLPAPAGGYSLEVWFKPASVVGTQVLWACDRATLKQEGNKVFFTIKTTGGTYSSGSVEVQVGRVYHVVGVWDGGTHAALYINTVRKEFTVVSPAATNNTFLSLGAWWDGTSPANADFEKAAIYSGRLEESKIQRHYEVGRAVRTVLTPTTRQPVRAPRRLIRVNRKLPSVPSGKGWLGFSSGAIPTADWVPFSPRSVWNKSTAGAPEHPISGPIIKNLVTKWGLPKAPTVGKQNMWLEDFSHPIYVAEPTDQMFSIEVTGSWFEFGVFQATKAPVIKIPIPANAIPAVGSDGHIGIILPGGLKVDCWQAVINRGTGKLKATNASLNRIDGSGIDGFATAGHFDLAAGEIRYEELAAQQINHPLFAVVKGLGKNWPEFGFGVKEGGNSDYVFPAGAGDAIVEAAYQKIPFPPMGCWIRLNLSDAQINAMAIPPYRKTVWRCLSDHGLYIGDTGGGGFEWHFASSTPYVALGSIDPFILLAQKEGINPNADGSYSFDMATGMTQAEWEANLQVLVPPS